MIRTYKKFLEELDKGTKQIEVSADFYSWLKENVGFSDTVNDPKLGPISTVYGIKVYKTKR